MLHLRIGMRSADSYDGDFGGMISQIDCHLLAFASAFPIYIFSVAAVLCAMCRWPRRLSHLLNSQPSIAE